MVTGEQCAGADLTCAVLSPYPHQLEAAAFLAGHEGGCLFDAPGLGKSLSTVLAADKVGARSVLVLCPSVVKHHWARTFRDCQTVERPVSILVGLPGFRPPDGVVIASYAAVTQPQHAAKFIENKHWDVIVADEAHEARTVTAKRTVNLLGASPTSLWKHSNYTWPLTGTPIVNSAADLYPIMSSVLARRLGVAPSWSDFCHRYTEMKPDFRGKLAPRGIKNGDELMAALRPHMLARTLDDAGITLPPLRIAAFPVDVTDDDLRPILTALDGVDRGVLDAYAAGDWRVQDEEISRTRHALGLAKAPAAAECIAAIVGQRQPVVAFFIHHDVRDAILSKLDPKLRVGVIDGSTQATSHTTQDAFQTGRLDVLLIQIVAGGVGITLTAGSRCLIVEQPWTAKDLEQAVKRLHRIGQSQSVLAEVLYAQGCWLDEVKARIIAEKAAVSRFVLGQ